MERQQFFIIQLKEPTMSKNKRKPAPQDYNPLADDQEGLYRRAVAIVAADRKPNTSYIQRQLKIGYNLAASLVERMEKEGIVSAADHVGKRQVIGPVVPPESEKEADKLFADPPAPAAAAPADDEEAEMEAQLAADLPERAAFPMLRLDCKDLKTRLRKLKPFISTEKTRHYLCGVLFSYFDKQLTLCATNGHILQEHIFDVEAELSEDLAPFKVIIPGEAISHLLKVLPTGKDAGFCTMQPLDSGRNVRFDFFEFEYITATVKGVFPDYKAIMPLGKTTLQTNFNAGYLISALQALGDTAVDILVDDAEDSQNAPHLLTSQKQAGLKCVIMPTRL